MTPKRVLLATRWGDRLAHALERDPGIELVTDAADVVVTDTADVPAAKRVVLVSSADAYGCEPSDPAFFDETIVRSTPPRTRAERDTLAAEAAVPTAAILRFADVLGPSVKAPLLGLPAVPTILGFDRRQQFIHEDDVIGCLEHAVRNDVDGIYNCAADGVLALSEVIGLLGKRNLPVLPPLATELPAFFLRRFGVQLSPEMLRQLRFGRALDNRKLKAAGYRYRYTTRETVLMLREHQHSGAPLPALAQA